MCRSLETLHTYSGCKLHDEEEDGPPNNKAGFWHRISRVLQRAPEGEPGEEPVEVKPEFHIVTLTSIFQCPEALNHPTQRQVPIEKRQCPNTTAWTPGDEAPVKAIETEHKDECPVCQAAEEAMVEASNRSEVVSIALPSERHFLTNADISTRSTSTSSKYPCPIKDVPNILIARDPARESPWCKEKQGQKGKQKRRS